MTSDSSERSVSSGDDVAVRDAARRCIEGCGLPGLFEDSRFLPIDSLLELAKALTLHAQPRPATLGGAAPSEGAATVFLELLCRVALWNQDRIAQLWPAVHAHFVELLAGASEATPLVRRAAVSVLRLARRLLRKPEVSAAVIDSLRLLHALPPAVATAVCEPPALQRWSQTRRWTSSGRMAGTPWWGLPRGVGRLGGPCSSP